VAALFGELYIKWVATFITNGRFMALGFITLMLFYCCAQWLKLFDPSVDFGFCDSAASILILDQLMTRSGVTLGFVRKYGPQECYG
jgi:hypothetical protein